MSKLKPMEESMKRNFVPVSVIVLASISLVLFSIAFGNVMRNERLRSQSEIINIKKVHIELLSEEKEGGQVFIISCTYQQDGVQNEIIFFTKKPEVYEEDMRVMCGEK